MCKVETITPMSGDEALLKDYAKLQNAVDSFDNPEHSELPTGYFQSSFSFSNADLSEDFVLVRNNAGDLIASGTIFTEDNSSLTSRLMIQVHPHYRCQGIGSEVLNHLVQIGLKRGASEFVCRVPSFRSYAASFVEKHGFKLDYTWVKMQIELRNPAPVFPHPIGLTVRALNVKEELTTWAQLQNTIFKESPGYEAVNAEILDSIIKHRIFDSSLLVIGTYFSEPIGCCLGFSIESMNKEKILQIKGMGVLPQFQRRGYGCAIVSEILKRAYIKQHVSSELVVLSSNRTAISLYEKCGFKESYKLLGYKKTAAQQVKGRDEIG
ncbi:MAG: GNAT family N-acetyltransferase [Candidatus Thorarchaeota archaeon]|nr:GNAT family N-acetyltransferase [Candidatus Thorarchaeota archaeon]